MDNLGPRIRSAREAAGLTQPELAQRIGVSGTTIKNWESGRARPTQLGKVEQVLGVNLRDIGSTEPRLDEASVPRLLAELGSRFATDQDEIARLRALLDNNVTPIRPNPGENGLRGRRAARTRDPQDMPDSKPDSVDRGPETGPPADPEADR